MLTIVQGNQENIKEFYNELVINHETDYDSIEEAREKYEIEPGSFALVYKKGDLLLKGEWVEGHNDLFFEEGVTLGTTKITPTYTNEFVMLEKLQEDEAFPRLYGFDEKNNVTIMEYIDGESLYNNVLKKGVNVSKEIEEQVLESFRFVLKKGFFPYDVHFRHIILQKGRVRIFDTSLYQPLSYLVEENSFFATLSIDELAMLAWETSKRITFENKK